jgi:alkylhydroperoxidase family enzyme
LRETLRFLAAMTDSPDDLDAAPALAAGVSPEALRDAIYVAAAFNVIDRLADAIGAVPHSEAGLSREEAMAHEGRFFERGYA